MSKNETDTKKELGQVAEAVADFWLGMVTAGAKGLGAAGEMFREAKEQKPFLKRVARAWAAGATATFQQAASTAKDAETDLKDVQPGGTPEETSYVDESSRA